MRAFLQSLARSSIQALPARIRDFAFRALLDDYGIATVVASGEQGTFEGSPDDVCVFRAYVANRTWEPDAVDFFRRWFARRKGGTFIDIGANIGLITVPVVASGDVRGIAIEADPTNFRLLRGNVVRNRLEGRVQLHNVAVYDRKAQLEFEISPSNFGDHRVRGQGLATKEDHYGESERRTIRVPSDTLDAVVDVAELGSAVAIKMDIQGSEPFALRGGAAVLAAADVMLCEFWPYGMKRLGADVGAFLDELEASFRYAAILHSEYEPIGAPRPIVLGPIDATARELERMARDAAWQQVDLIVSKSPEPE
jgi:FkbM family methyltransferase